MNSKILKFDITKNIKKISKVIALLFLIYILIDLLFILFKVDTVKIFKSIPLIFNFIKNNFQNISSQNFVLMMLFFTSASIFIFPIPFDLAFIGFIHETNFPIKVILFSFIGQLIGQHINYILGRFFGEKLENKINKKSKAWIENKFNKYEKYAIFIFNLFPLPFPLLNFISGLTKFNYVKWLVLVMIAMFLRLSIYAMFF
ncbi:hypothetical protein HOD20_06370 [archaeon]|jgi:membrane protein YqaA with SNARE-associated domain|nr:hypothetical protein [archaeon]MBT4352127.1 hypothetical protein [archaeon]MBT6821670.1 hypothetical protein [archaeon]MBT7393075.1 hypothetical protein [archaeon]